MSENEDICPAPIIFTMIGGKWKLSILKALIFKGTMRFGALRREIDGITQTMLTQQLRALEADGLVERQIFPEVPPRVEYSVTDDGKALKPVFEAMHKWWLEQKR
ncbi:winged helix-turn-helix transcriptional regulator [Ahrensia marina]|uniref:Transcriptional regulator n=1 Tax=Ahrensia marina TaxID=1514904 RepID=A0A0N0E7M0_9HYPH|nr:helix-turn-helix domain-containing protein [Ahrensia marina]KPB01351.1 transcriptional regulator [Ahrensia marina]